MTMDNILQKFIILIIFLLPSNAISSNTQIDSNQEIIKYGLKKISSLSSSEDSSEDTWVCPKYDDSDFEFVQ